jgi:high-affinity K+ transport system ATPase subunit B
MVNFWENVLRYPKFFIISVIGLMVIIISPVRKIFANPNTKWFSIIIVIILFFCIILTVTLIFYLC